MSPLKKFQLIMTASILCSLPSLSSLIITHWRIWYRSLSKEHALNGTIIKLRDLKTESLLAPDFRKIANLGCLAKLEIHTLLDVRTILANYPHTSSNLTWLLSSCRITSPLTSALWMP